MFFCCRLEEHHKNQGRTLTSEVEDQRGQLTQMEKEVNYLQAELDAQKEANVRSPSNTMRNLVERLKAQLAQKEKRLKVGCSTPPRPFTPVETTSCILVLTLCPLRLSIKLCWSCGEN